MRCRYEIGGRKMKAMYNIADTNSIGPDLQDMIATELYYEMYLEFLRTERAAYKFKTDDNVPGLEVNVMLRDNSVEFVKWLLTNTNTPPLYQQIIEPTNVLGDF